MTLPYYDAEVLRKVPVVILREGLVTIGLNPIGGSERTVRQLYRANMEKTPKHARIWFDELKEKLPVNDLTASPETYLLTSSFLFKSDPPTIEPHNQDSSLIITNRPITYLLKYYLIDESGIDDTDEWEHVTTESILDDQLLSELMRRYNVSTDLVSLKQFRQIVEDGDFATFHQLIPQLSFYHYNYSFSYIVEEPSRDEEYGEGFTSIRTMKPLRIMKPTVF